MITFLKSHTVLILIPFLFYAYSINAAQTNAQTESLKLAILRIGYEDFTEDERKEVNEALIRHLEKNRETSIVTEEEVRNRLIPFGIEPDEISDVTGYVHAGQLLRVDFVLVGAMDKIGDFVEVTFRIITMPKGMQLSYPAGKTFDIFIQEEIPKIVDKIYEDIHSQKQELRDHADQEIVVETKGKKRSKLWFALGGTVTTAIITGILLSADKGNEQTSQQALPRPPGAP